MTQHGLGGLPPTMQHAGGCSYIDQGQGQVNEPGSWAGYLARDLAVTSMVNLAASGHGNLLTASAVMWMLDHYAYDPRDTVVIFNVTEPQRFDMMCDWQDPDRSAWVPWSSQIMPNTWMDVGSRALDRARARITLDNVGRMSRLALEGLMSWLDQQGWQWWFMTMDDYDQDPYLASLVRDHPRRIDFGGQRGMTPYVVSQGWSDDGYHPTDHGHRAIADWVLERIKA